MSQLTPKEKRAKRIKRIRAKISGTKERPRLAIYNSLKYIYAQIIDDEKGHTLVAVSSKKIPQAKTPNIETARKLGKLIAEKAKKKGISKVVLDTRGKQYHGRIRALAEEARKASLKF